ncbi:hypothetical protein ACL9RI_08590 [Janthinobacterium sp. Mn2066]|uniref:hypothetical protein n=1 Tax=Janthinobacterium sp. Mn2066 TaxID=3395264 RepID=UPI003BDBCA23
MLQHIGVITRVKGVAVTQHKLANSIKKVKVGLCLQGTDWKEQAAGRETTQADVSSGQIQHIISSIIH